MERRYASLRTGVGTDVGVGKFAQVLGGLGHHQPAHGDILCPRIQWDTCGTKPFYQCVVVCIRAPPLYPGALKVPTTPLPGVGPVAFLWALTLRAQGSVRARFNAGYEPTTA